MINNNRQIVLIAHNLRSTHNVGSLLRTAEGLGVERVFLTGYSPYPKMVNDDRLPHLAEKIERQISKTALGAEKFVRCLHEEDVFKIIEKLKNQKFTVLALEQSRESISLPTYKIEGKIALIVGREVEGIEPEVIEAVDKTLEIPMFGKKESFNVAQAAAMALYHLRFSDSC